MLAQGTAPALVTPDSARPQVPFGVMSGDVTDRCAIVWSRTDRPARMAVEVATDGLQFFGIGKIDARGRALTVSLHGIEGQTLFKVELPPEA